ncbi:MAG: hypothetical protein HY516_02690 [Candidatus Aenigmarchaeota archaeon]|nr:hypothetical protein [Candidatus Aenigmarchaeota archaeon]
MKESSWNDCIEENTAVKISPDKARAKSLVETAGERIKLISEVNDKNCNFVFEDYYTSIMEMLQAIVLSKGYKISNHVCLGYYVRDVLKRTDLYAFFDDVRYKRNSLTYYGKRMDFETAVQAIEKCKRIIKETEKIFKA